MKPQVVKTAVFKVLGQINGCRSAIWKRIRKVKAKLHLCIFSIPTKFVYRIRLAVIFGWYLVRIWTGMQFIWS